MKANWMSEQIVEIAKEKLEPRQTKTSEKNLTKNFGNLLEKTKSCVAITSVIIMKMETYTEKQAVLLNLQVICYHQQ